MWSKAACCRSLTCLQVLGQLHLGVEEPVLVDVLLVLDLLLVGELGHGRLVLLFQLGHRCAGISPGPGPSPPCSWPPRPGSTPCHSGPSDSSQRRRSAWRFHPCSWPPPPWPSPARSSARRHPGVLFLLRCRCGPASGCPGCFWISMTLSVPSTRRSSIFA